jgi:hypothetical protein
VGLCTVALLFTQTWYELVRSDFVYGIK